MRVDEYAQHDATALAELISGGEVSAAEVREAALAALAAVDHEVHAVAHGPFEDAPDPEPGPFAGVPFAIKDTLMEAGRPLEFGSRLLEGFVAPCDVTLTERFRAAGLVSLARTATPEFAFNVDTAPDLREPTRNPWDLDRSAGGSSGGAAALVASGALPMAHGNDGGGSIRLPAAYCGLVGLKPSRGRVSRGPDSGDSFLVADGVLSRTVLDTAAALDVLAGYEVGDSTWAPPPGEPYVKAVEREPGPLRVFVATENPLGTPIAAEGLDAVRAVGDALSDLG